MTKLILGLAHIPQEFGGERRESQGLSVIAELAVALGGLHQAQFAQIAGESYLRRVDPGLLERFGQFVLRGDALGRGPA